MKVYKLLTIVHFIFLAFFHDIKNCWGSNSHQLIENEGFTRPQQLLSLENDSQLPKLRNEEASLRDHPTHLTSLDPEHDSLLKKKHENFIASRVIRNKLTSEEQNLPSIPLEAGEPLPSLYIPHIFFTKQDSPSDIDQLLMEMIKKNSSEYYIKNQAPEKASDTIQKFSLENSKYSGYNPNFIKIYNPEHPSLSSSDASGKEVTANTDNSKHNTSSEFLDIFLNSSQSSSLPPETEKVKISEERPQEKQKNDWSNISSDISRLFHLPYVEELIKMYCMLLLEAAGKISPMHLPKKEMMNPYAQSIKDTYFGMKYLKRGDFPKILTNLNLSLENIFSPLFYQQFTNRLVTLFSIDPSANEGQETAYKEQILHTQNFFKTFGIPAQKTTESSLAYQHRIAGDFIKELMTLQALYHPDIYERLCFIWRGLLENSRLDIDIGISNCDEAAINAKRLIGLREKHPDFSNLSWVDKVHFFLMQLFYTNWIGDPFKMEIAPKCPSELHKLAKSGKPEFLEMLKLENTWKKWLSWYRLHTLQKYYEEKGYTEAPKIPVKVKFSKNIYPTFPGSTGCDFIFSGLDKTPVFAHIKGMERNKENAIRTLVTDAVYRWNGQSFEAPDPNNDKEFGYYFIVAYCCEPGQNKEYLQKIEGNFQSLCIQSFLLEDLEKGKIKPSKENQQSEIQRSINNIFFIETDPSKDTATYHTKHGYNRNFHLDFFHVKCTNLPTIKKFIAEIGTQIDITQPPKGTLQEEEVFTSPTIRLLLPLTPSSFMPDVTH